MKKLLVAFATICSMTLMAQKDTLKWDLQEVPDTYSPACRKFEEKLYLSSIFDKPADKQKYIDSLTNCMIESPDLFLTLGKYYYAQGDYVKASQEFLKITRLKTSDKVLGEAHSYLGLAFHYLHAPDQSFWHSNEALRLGYQPSWSYNNMGLSLYRKGQLNEAIVYYKKALRADPGNDIAANNISSACFDLHDHREALKYSCIADSIANGNKAAYQSNRIRNLIELQRQSEAYALAEEAYKKFPNDQDIIVHYSRALCDQRKFSEALVLGRKLLRMDPSNSYEWFAVAYIYDVAGELDSALYFYKRCVRYNPNDAPAQGNIGLIYKDLGRFEEAHAQLDLALSITPWSHYLYEQKQTTYLWQRDYENSYIWALKCLTLFPERKGYEFRVGYALQQLKKYDEAIPYYRVALLFEPGDDRLYNNMGRCFAELGLQDSAGKYFQLAVNRNPDNGYIYHNRAAFYYDLGMYDSACMDLKMAIDKEYNWHIDEKLIAMKSEHCPEVNTNIKVLINEFRGNHLKFGNRRFIELEDSAMKESIQMMNSADQQIHMPVENEESAGSFNTFNLFPNPNRGSFYIESASMLSGSLTIRVYDVKGNLVLSDTMSNTKRKEFFLNNPSAGIYVLVILNDRSVLTTKRVVLE